MFLSLKCTLKDPNIKTIYFCLPETVQLSVLGITSHCVKDKSCLALLNRSITIEKILIYGYISSSCLDD